MKHHAPSVALLIALALATSAWAQQPFPSGPVNPPSPPRDSTGLTPLTELGTAKYKGDDGGNPFGVKLGPSGDPCLGLALGTRLCQPAKTMKKTRKEGSSLFPVGQVFTFKVI
jgi:hypothetical protein